MLRECTRRRVCKNSKRSVPIWASGWVSLMASITAYAECLAFAAGYLFREHQSQKARERFSGFEEELLSHLSSSHAAQAVDDLVLDIPPAEFWVRRWGSPPFFPPAHWHPRVARAGVR